MSAMAPAEQIETLAKGGKYLTFALGDEEYGFEILKVREIIGCMDITAVPRVPEFIKGVINLRGQVISVMDLRGRFGMPPAPRTDQTCIIVVEIEADGRRFSTGVIVDRVLEVLNIPAEQIENAPSFGAGMDNNFILGMGKCDKTVKILLDIDTILSRQQAAPLSNFTRGK